MIADTSSSLHFSRIFGGCHDICLLYLGIMTEVHRSASPSTRSYLTVITALKMYANLRKKPDLGVYLLTD